MPVQPFSLGLFADEDTRELTNESIQKVLEVIRRFDIAHEALGIDEPSRRVMIVFATNDALLTRYQVQVLTNLPRTTCNRRIDMLRDAGAITQGQDDGSGREQFFQTPSQHDFTLRVSKEAMQIALGTRSTFSEEIIAGFEAIPGSSPMKIRKDLQRLHFGSM